MAEQGEVAERHKKGFVGVALVTVASVLAIGFGVIGAVDAFGTKGCGYGYGGYCSFAISVHPTHDLVDGQSVALGGRGFSPNTTFGAAVCDPSVPGIDGCDLSNTPLTTTDRQGRASLTIHVRRIITVQGRRVDCAHTPCVLGAGTVNGLIPIETTSVPLTFDPTVPPLPTLKVRLDGAAATTRSVHGSISCTRASQASVSGTVYQRINGTEVVASGVTVRPITCSTTPTSWSFTYNTGHSGDLVPGEARLVLFASTSDDLDSASSTLSETITLTAPPSVPTR